MAECPTQFTTNGQTCVSPTSSELISYTFIKSFDEFTSQAGASINSLSTATSGLSALAATGRGLYFNGSDTDYVYFASNFVLNSKFSIHSWIYTFTETNRDDMTLFSKDLNGSPTADDISFVTFGVDSNLQFKTGLTPTHGDSANYSESVSNVSLVVDVWTYVTYNVRIDSSVTTEVQIQQNEDGTIFIDTWENNIVVDNSNNEAYIAIERSGSTTNFVNPWYGYIYDFHIHQSEGTSHRRTSNCDSGCTACPLDGECPWDVNWDLYTDENDAEQNCDTSTCENIGCRRDGRCQDCSSTTGQVACHMCFDYYCHECPDMEQGTCTVCNGAGTSGALSTGPDPGNCQCSDDIYGRQYSRTDYQTPCCANGCSSCIDEIYYAYCTACSDTMFTQPDTGGALFVCFDHCPTGYSEVSGPPNSCSGTEGLIIDYDLTYIEHDFENLAVNGKNVGTLASSQGNQFDDTLPYKLRGAYGNGTNAGIHIPDLVLHHSFSLTFWIWPNSLTGIHTLFSKDTGSYLGTNDENFLDIVVLQTGALQAELYIVDTAQFDGRCRTPEGQVSTTGWKHVAFRFLFNGTDTNVKIDVEDATVLDWTSNAVFIKDEPSYSNAWLFMRQSSNAGEPSPTEAFHGFIYRFRLYNYYISHDTLDSAVNCQSDVDYQCDGGCTCCSTLNNYQCLWTVDRDEFLTTEAVACDNS